MIKKTFLKFKIHTYLSIILLFFSFFINYIYSSYGVFPIDTFLHYDSSYRITQGEYPIKDFWIVSGILVDFLGAFFFQIFGVNWSVYILHSSLLNSLFAISTFFFLCKIELKPILAFFYSILGSVLAYPPSGTPFVDHHAVLLCLLSGYFLILAITLKKNIYWFLFPIFLSLSFLSKQVPSSYLIILFSFILLFYCLIKKNFKPIFLSFCSGFTILLIFFLFLEIFEIKFHDFLLQYILYPQSIGIGRLESLEFNFISLFNTYKFIILPFIILLILNIKFFLKKSFFKEDKFFVLIIIFFILISFLTHQLLSKNQIFIYFLIPIFSGLIHLNLDKEKFRINKQVLVYSIILFTVFTVFKYHFRYNENRKFHDLHNVNLNNAIPAEILDESLEGLKWITNDFENDPKNEIEILKKIKDYIVNDNENKILITHYSFFSAISNQKLFSPSKTYTLDGASFPVKNNVYYEKYKNFFTRNIKNNSIKNIYLIDSENLDNKIVENYLKKNCYQLKKIKYLKIYRVNDKCF